MFLSGMADEAGQDLTSQINAHKELGFNHIELRLVDGQQFTQLDEATFEQVTGTLADAGLRISCYGSAIANWARPISGDFGLDIADLKRNIPRMQKTNTSFIRVMSWPNASWTQDEWGNEAVKRMKELATLAEDGGITLALENCDGYGAQNATKMLEFIERVNSDALKVVFDTGNSVAHHLNSLDMYTQVKSHIAYVHIKDSYRDSDDNIHYVLPNKGQGFVRQILTDLHANGYDGGISIEPHVMAVVHKGERGDNSTALYNSYIEYGETLKMLVGSIWKK